ncbi:hypothetical protein [Burkholderia ubonensis]|uniref:hypothetical protein n=1 Tax=Burkholderia ubonensis TaxID=101571 RepID=UPI001160C326|nr:hypothetical protein [Burkholderia ubonensis]
MADMRANARYKNPAHCMAPSRFLTGGEGETIQGSGLAWKIFPNCIAGHSSDEKIAPVPGMMRISHMPIA